jgi:hypothetical protein
MQYGQYNVSRSTIRESLISGFVISEIWNNHQRVINPVLMNNRFQPLARFVLLYLLLLITSLFIKTIFGEKEIWNELPAWV